MPERRQLAFNSVQAILPDVNRLIAGHVTVGRWNLGEICDHLAKTIILSMEFPSTNATATREQAVYRRLLFRAREFPEGQTPPLAVQLPTPNADLIESAAFLRSAIARFELHESAFSAHPMLGPLTRDEWFLFHTRHSAHHLSFAIPM